MNCARAGLEHLHGSVINTPRYLSVIDHDTECQHECRLVPGGPSCIFESMETFCSDDLATSLRNECEPYDTDRLFDLMSQPGALRQDGYCVVHRRRCPYPRARAHSGSIPCTDWTSWGKGLMYHIYYYYYYCNYDYYYYYYFLFT